MEDATKNLIIELYPDDVFMFADGFDDAIIGICTKTNKIVYSKTKCIEVLCKDMEEEEAEEYFSYNVDGAYVGELTPIFVDDTMLFE